MRRLPHWALTCKIPAFYDLESASSIEMTAKLYKAMQELIEEYNKYAEELNLYLEEFEQSTNQNMDEFKKCVSDMMARHIQCMDNKIDEQDKVISNAVQYMKDNIRTVTFEVVETMFKNGEITFATNYDAASERLDLSIDYGLTE